MKKTARKSRLDALESKLRTVLRRETLDIIEAGNILLEIKDELGHGEWLPWLAKNFDLSERTAQRYIGASEYVASKSDTVADFANLAPNVLYWLVADRFSKQEEAAILAATREGRVDDDRADTICMALEPPAPPSDSDAENQQDDGGDDKAENAEEDTETKQILDGAPPAVPPPAPITPPDVALPAFDEAVSSLKRLMTKPAAQFANTVHSTSDLEKVERFINAVTAALPEGK